MNNIKAIEFLGDEGVGRTYADLKEAHGINFRFSQDGNKVSLNYDMIASKYGDPVAEQCRGLVLNARTMQVLCRPMDRFYNAGDFHAATVDWADPGLRVYEKLDGTMVAVYHDGEKWCCATRSVPDADIPIKAGDLEIGDATFADLFWAALHTTLCMPLETSAQDWFESWQDKGLTYVFELTSPHNRIVVEYLKAKVTLLAVRHTATGREGKPELYDFPTPRTWKLDTPEAVAAFVNSCLPHEMEGAVVCDSQFRRVKVKSKAYVMASKCAAGVGTSLRSALEAATLGKLDDVLPLVSDAMRQKLVKLQDDLHSYTIRTDVMVAAYSGKAADRKEYAGLVMGSKVQWKDVFFKLYKANISTADYIRQLAESGKLSDTTLDSILKDVTGD